MRHYLALIIALAVLFLLVFAVFEALEIPLLPAGGLASLAGPVAALTGVGLLALDIFLPVPSSLVMTANGALFGILLGTVLSTVGALAGSLLGFWIGRRGGPLLTRLVPAEERERADALLQEWGELAIVVSRPVPILAESVAILAGTAPLTWRRLSTAAVAGIVPPALLYAVAGSAAVSFASSSIVFLAVLAVAGLFWWLGRRFRARGHGEGSPIASNDTESGRALTRRVEIHYDGSSEAGEEE